MFRIFSIDKNNNEKEVLPDNGLYVVYELHEYRFHYTGVITQNAIFIEDELFDYSSVIFEENSIKSKEKKRIFEDYFGYLTITVNNEKFNFEVRIQKLKVPELEEILLYLWNQDPIIFDNFFSKSTLKSKLDHEKQSLDYSSKFVNIFEDYFAFFKSKYLIFKSLPHYVLRAKNTVIDYELAEISNNSIDWLVNNLDELNIDFLYKNLENSIQINNNYGLVEKILTEVRLNNFNVYENQVILGSFVFINLEIGKLKNKIRNYIPPNQSYEKEFYSINEFKIIPFLKLRDDLEKIESKIRFLQRKYEEIFTQTKPNNSSPKLTPVFSNKRHYSDAYKKIKLIRDIKINLDDELNLLNIKKISTLYERFNLFILVNSLLSKNPNIFSKESPKEFDNIFQEFYFQFTNFKVSLFYDYKVDNIGNKTGLQRISKGYYKPDYILKTESKTSIKIYILDSKYSSENTVKNNHLLKCIKDYILDIGVTDSYLVKAEELILIYPGEREEVIFGNNFFKPKISIIPSKVKKENLKNFIDSIFNNNIEN
jgi:hypothetical protein